MKIEAGNGGYSALHGKPETYLGEVSNSSCEEP
jgi:hypothetical protein